MTATYDASRYQHALERWRVLAERRLEHMTVLYETGRWRRYFTEEKFAEVIRQTRAAVEAWDRLAPREAAAARLVALMSEDGVARTMPPPSPFATPLPELHP